MQVRTGHLTETFLSLQQVARYAKTLLGKNATIWRSVYETPDSQHEHDVVAFDEHLCIVFEAKASPPRDHYAIPRRPSQGFEMTSGQASRQRINREAELLVA